MPFLFLPIQKDKGWNQIWGLVGQQKHLQCLGCCGSQRLQTNTYPLLYHKEDAIIMRICTECCYWCCVFQILNLTPLIVTILNQHHLLNHFHYIFNFLANILLKIQSFNQCTRTFQQICDKPNPYLYQEQAVICLYYLVGGQLNSTLIRLCL